MHSLLRRKDVGFLDCIDMCCTFNVHFMYVFAPALGMTIRAGFGFVLRIWVVGWLIGFVSYFWVVAGWRDGRLGSFRFLGVGQGDRGGKLGSFRVMGGAAGGCGVEIGFVLRIWLVGWDFWIPAFAGMTRAGR